MGPGTADLVVSVEGHLMACTLAPVLAGERVEVAGLAYLAVVLRPIGLLNCGARGVYHVTFVNKWYLVGAVLKLMFDSKLIEGWIQSLHGEESNCDVLAKTYFDDAQRLFVVRLKKKCLANRKSLLFLGVDLIFFKSILTALAY